MKRSNTKKLIRSFLINQCLFLNLILFSPMEVYLANYVQFEFPINNVWWIMTLTAILTTIVCSIVEAFLPTKIVDVLNGFALGLSICIFVQAMFLNGYMKSFLGEDIVFPTSVVIKNILVWVLILAIAEFGFLKLKEKKIELLSVCITIVLLSGFIVSILSTNFERPQKEYALTSDSYLELGDEANVLYFIIDTADQKIIDKIVEDKAEILNSYNGFIYYPDAIPTYTRTYPSITYMLTHEKCYFDKDIWTYEDIAWDNSYLADVKQSGADCRLFVSFEHVSGNAVSIVDNLECVNTTSISAIRPFRLVTQMMYISLYRDLPYALKPYFYYSSNIMNDLVMKRVENEHIAGDDRLSKMLIYDQDLTISDDYSKALRYYYFWGCHTGGYMDENGNYIKNSDEYRSLQGTLVIINRYLDYLKENDLYDKTAIIITADHGTPTYNDELELSTPHRCMLLYKPLEATEDDEFVISYDWVSHEDLFDVVTNTLETEKSYNIPNHETRIQYATTLRDDIDGEIALREYEITGNADEINNWKLTGNYWDINYSQRTVSKERLNVG